MVTTCVTTWQKNREKGVPPTEHLQKVCSAVGLLQCVEIPI